MGSSFAYAANASFPSLAAKEDEENVDTLDCVSFKTTACKEDTGSSGFLEDRHCEFFDESTRCGEKHNMLWLDLLTYIGQIFEADLKNTN